MVFFLQLQRLEIYRENSLWVFKQAFFWCAPFGYLYFFHVTSKPGLGAGNDPGIAFLNHFHLVLDEIRTHDLSIMSGVC